jgi:hypothetical protein
MSLSILEELVEGVELLSWMCSECNSSCMQIHDSEDDFVPGCNKGFSIANWELEEGNNS